MLSAEALKYTIFIYVAECAACVCILNIFPLCFLYFNKLIITAIPHHYDMLFT